MPRRQRRDEHGASAVEYALLISGVAVVLVLVVFSFGGVVKGIFSKTCSSVQTRASTTQTCS
ncbi:Flp family type IVb pilin [Nocardioides mangrovicus]|uniref:Flp family type IVb pilin n=1 Tax=Nocardioides mangrovicus TaxID=2478913 RepID=UPI001E388EC9|nr:Flp family type IVb pilin [Nocardioides mangrovicus]